MKIPAFERRGKFLVGFPAMENWKSAFGMCVLELITNLMAVKVPGYRSQTVIPMQVKGSILPRSRMKLVKAAIDQDCTHILFIDTDQTFPKDTLHRLLQHGKDVVGCNIATKQIPASPTARARGSAIDGFPVFTDPDSPALEKVWRLGTGIMLIDVRVFKKIGLGVFEVRWVEEIQDYRGEDWHMCEAMERAGFDIWVDHKLSDEIGHVGDYEYTHDVVGSKELVPVLDKIIGEV